MRRHASHHTGLAASVSATPAAVLLTVFVAVYDSSNNILGGQIQSGNVITANQWQHIVIERFKAELSLSKRLVPTSFSSAKFNISST